MHVGGGCACEFDAVFVHVPLICFRGKFTAWVVNYEMCLVEVNWMSWEVE